MPYIQCFYSIANHFINVQEVSAAVPTQIDHWNNSPNNFQYSHIHHLSDPDFESLRPHVYRNSKKRIMNSTSD